MRNGDGGWLIGGGCYGITRLLLRWFLYGWRMARYDLSFPFLLSSRNDWFGDDQLASLPAFESARCVKVNPDTPQKQVRFLTLNGNKILMTPQPRLRTGFFSILESSSIPYLPDACTSAGVAKFGKPISLDDKLKVDLIVIGSVAVDPKTGARLGKGEGFAELEYGILRWMGAIDDSTLVVTTVHDQQLVDDIPLEKLLIHDVPVDIICTPTQIIHTNTKIPKPQGIYWEKLSRQKLGQIRVLQDLKKRIEKETGKTLPCAPDEVLPPLAVRKRPPPKGSGRTRNSVTPHKQTIFMWNLSPSTTKRELEDHVAQLGGDFVLTVRTSLKPGNNRQLAWVTLKDGADAGKIVKALDQSTLGEMVVRAKVDEPTSTGKLNSQPQSKWPSV
ncbi:hypothetical protein M758_8G185800 [Ceratodon purpureus]|nr:hypothetical protein M758_8G185800 [Ceratodon purpureus]